MRSFFLVALAWVGLGLVACSSDAPSCVEGTTQACACVGGTSGVQSCTAESRFGACDCAALPDGGMLDGASDLGADGGMLDGASDLGVDGGPIGTGDSVSAMVGSEGATLTLANVEVTVPAGALSTPTLLTVTETTMATPTGYRAFSPMYHFEPEGLAFAAPVTVSIRSRATGADVPLATLFWSRASTDGGGWDRRGGVPTAGNVVGSTPHFSYGFLADGVDYTATPDRSCVRTRVVDTRRLDPAGIGVFFGVDDCWGRPITDLSDADTVVYEDGVALSSEASARLFEQRGLQVFVTLAIDVSASTRAILPQIIGAARRFVETLNDPSRGLRDRVQVSIIGFAGEATGGFVQPHTLDLDRVLAQLDALAAYTPTDVSSTNLNGTVVRALDNNASAEAAFRARNRGGAFAAGYVVLFTDGTDTAGRVTLASAQSAVSGSTDDIVAVGLRGADYDPVALRTLVGATAVIDADESAVLDRDFAYLAARVAGQVRRTYLVGYCSPKRSGVHTVYATVRGATTTVSGTAPEFDATGFTGGCAVDMFDPATVCAGAECGGFGCGACDDRVAMCDTRATESLAGACVSLCVTAGTCSGETITNLLGYEQGCPSSAEWSSCDGACRDASYFESTALNCGVCGNVCAGPCRAGACVGIADLALGSSHSCALLTDASVHCWGDNNYDQLGEGGTATSHANPVAVPGLVGVVELAAGGAHNCARFADGTARCWGYNSDGELGDGTTIRARVPVVVSGLTGAVELSGGTSHTCARISDGTVRCWGLNTYGEIGDGTSGVIRSVPTLVSGLAGAVEVTTGSVHTCARLTDGTVWCWGENSSGELGDGTRINRLTPVGVAGLGPAVQLAMNGSHTCALLGTGGVRCWGDNFFGGLGDGTFTGSITPVAVLGLSSAVEIAAGGRHTCARLLDGTAQCWGWNNFGQIGDGTITDRVAPSPVSGVSGVVQIRVGAVHGCATLGDGSIWCWGDNSRGQLGDGTLTQRRVPVRVIW